MIKKKQKVKNKDQNKVASLEQKEDELSFDFQFNSLSFNDWYKLVQYVINYDLIYSNLEYLNELNFRLSQLNYFLKKNGSIGHEYVSELAKYQQKYKEMVQAKNELNEENGLDEEILSNASYQDFLVKLIEKKVRNQILNNNEYDDKFKEELNLLFLNPFFLAQDDQQYNLRLKSLQFEKKVILKNIKLIKPHERKYLRNLNLFEEQAFKIMGDPNFDFKKLFMFVRPYINNIITSDDYYYTKLFEKTIFE